MKIRHKIEIVYVALVMISFALYYYLSVFDPLSQSVKYSVLMGAFYPVLTALFVSSKHKSFFNILLVLVTIFFSLAYISGIARYIFFMKR